MVEDDNGESNRDMVVRGEVGQLQEWKLFLVF